MEKRFKFRHVNELTGLFVLVVLAFVVAGLIVSGHSQRWFAHKYNFAIRLPKAGAFGLRRGDEVFIFGVSVGSVADIQVNNFGNMTARVKIRDDFQQFVRVDSIATIKKTFGVAGDSFMEISRGTGSPLSSDKPEISCQAAEELPGMLEKMVTDLRTEVMEVVRKAGTTFETWSQLGADLRKTQVDLNQFVNRLDKLATGVEQGKGTAGKLLTDTAVVDEAQRALAEATEAMTALRGILTNADAVVKNVDKGTARLPEITDALAHEAKDLPGLVAQTQATMRELERLIEGLQRHWLIRKYVNKTNPPPLSPLPADESSNPSVVKPLRSPRESR
jgi:phospholipid/cholesterol/gamma-HCH transport system substrate-binding protein